MEDEEEGELASGIISPHYKAWYDKNGRLHRLNGPAIIYYDGYEEWYRHGKLHRDDGPARAHSSADIEEWWKDDYFYEPSAHELITWKMKKKES
jgi:hypothetical protein